MKQVFVLSGKDIRLAAAEVLSLAKGPHALVGDLLVAETDMDLRGRLAYTHYVDRLLYETDNPLDAKGFDFRQVCAGSFCVRLRDYTHSGITEAALARQVWNSLESPKVDLVNPGTRIDFFVTQEKTLVCQYIGEADKSYLERLPKKRPYSHPTSMHPALARACINLTGIMNGRMLDPFCGTGGILIEGGMMGYEVTGYDLDRGMLDKCRANLHFYRIDGFSLENRDSTRLDGRFGLIVTDLPYGRNSRLSVRNLQELYRNFLRSAYSVAPVAVVVFPSFIDHKLAVSETKWRIKDEFTCYLHRSLSRKIIKLER